MILQLNFQSDRWGELKNGTPIHFIHELQFTLRKEYPSACEDSDIICFLSLRGAFQSCLMTFRSRVGPPLSGAGLLAGTERLRGTAGWEKSSVFENYK